MDRPVATAVLFVFLCCLLGLTGYVLLTDPEPEEAPQQPQAVIEQLPAVDFEQDILSVSADKPVFVVFRQGGSADNDKGDILWHLGNLKSTVIDKAVWVEADLFSSPDLREKIDSRGESVGIALYSDQELVGVLSGIRPLPIYSQWVQGQMDRLFPPDESEEGTNDDGV